MTRLKSWQNWKRVVIVATIAWVTRATYQWLVPDWLDYWAIAIMTYMIVSAIAADVWPERRGGPGDAHWRDA